MNCISIAILVVGATQSPKPLQAPPLSIDQVVWVVTESASSSGKKASKPTRGKSNAGCDPSCTCPCTSGGECTCLTYRNGKIVRVGTTWLPGYAPTSSGCNCGPNCGCSNGSCGCDSSAGGGMRVIGRSISQPYTYAAPTLAPMMGYGGSFGGFGGGFGGGGCGPGG